MYNHASLQAHRLNYKRVSFFLLTTKIKLSPLKKHPIPMAWNNGQFNRTRIHNLFFFKEASHCWLVRAPSCVSTEKCHFRSSKGLQAMTDSTTHVPSPSLFHLVSGTFCETADLQVAPRTMNFFSQMKSDILAYTWKNGKPMFAEVEANFNLPALV